MQGSKIRLSAAEAELLGNAEIILTKNSVLQKTAALLANVQDALLADAPPSVASSPSPKISKGENYLGLPYVVLDYPRKAAGEDLFFIRSFFWWGRFFSSTLQLAGSFKQKHLPALITAYEPLSARGYFVGTNADPWVHHFGDDNVRRVAGLSKQAFALVLEETPHVKIAAHWPLAEWDSAEEKLVGSWRFLLGLLKESK